MTVSFYRRFGNWRWTIKSSNGRKIGASSEGYKNKLDAVSNFELVTHRSSDSGLPNDHIAAEGWIVEGL